MRPSSVAFTHLLGCAANGQLPSKPKTLSLRQTLTVAVCTCNPNPGVTDRRILGAHWPARLLELESSRLNETLSQKGKPDETEENTNIDLWTSHMCKHTCLLPAPHVCTQT